MNPGLQGQSVATGVLAHIRKQIPGYTWLTNRHMPGAKSFWQLIAERTGEDYADTEPAHTCEHMALFWYRGPTRAATRNNVSDRQTRRRSGQHPAVNRLSSGTKPGRATPTDSRTPGDHGDHVGE